MPPTLSTPPSLLDCPLRTTPQAAATPAEPALTPALVRPALEQLLASPTFLKARRLSELLQFLVERTVAGGASSINEYTIGLEVLKRPASSFDPAEDPTVRVQIRRLREKLKEYYSNDGMDAIVRFEIPVGTHVPVIYRQPENAISLLPTLMLAPLQIMASAGDSLHCLKALQEDLVHQLFRKFGRNLLTLPCSHGSGDGAAEQIIQARALGATHLLEGSVRQLGTEIRLSLRLLAVADARLIWSEQFDRPDLGSIALQEDLARQVAEAVHAPLQASVAMVAGGRLN